jgi:2,3-dihydroxy-p-cumate/2,3-dihydroxybenzoate 3,4-dioxygenase
MTTDLIDTTTVPFNPPVAACGYVALGTRDLDAAIDFYDRIVQLEVSDRRDGVAFLRGGLEHHWVRLEEAEENGFLRMGYRARDLHALDEITERLTDHGISWTEQADLPGDRVDRAIRFRAPEGIELEIYHQMVEMPTAPAPRPIRLRGMLHGVWQVKDVPAAAAFFNEVLGFRVSDWIEQRTAFMRCGDGYHHSLAILEGDDPGRFMHFAMRVESIDDVMRIRRHATEAGAEIGMEIMRHSPSGSVGVYIVDPMHGFTVEYAADHRRIARDDEPHYLPRILPRIPETSDAWKGRGILG